MIPAFFVLAALVFTVRTGPVVEYRLNGSHLPYEVQLPDLHKELRIETLGGERTIVIENKSRR